MSSNARSGTKGMQSNERARLLRLLLQERSTSKQQIQRCPRRESEGKVRLPTSSGQQRLWFIDQLEEGGAPYHVAIALRLRGTLDEAALYAALSTIVRRHEALRTVFVSVDGEPQQEISPQERLPLKAVDLSGYHASERETQIQCHKNEEYRERFDLREGPLIRGRLLRISRDEHVLLITMHHIISDGWSLGVFFDEFTRLYGEHEQLRDHALEALPIQYGDYVQWQRERLHAENYEQQLGYWTKQLRDAPPQIELPSDRVRPAAQSYRGDSVRIVLDPLLTGQLRALAQRQQMTLFMVLLTGLTVLLARLSGQDDVVVGTPIANRQHAQVEKLIGFFVNTLALRVALSKDMRLSELLEQIKGVTLGAYAHQDVPFEKVVEALQPQRSLSRNPIFQVMFALQNAPKSELRLPGMTVTTEEAGEELALFDLLLVLEERGEEIVGTATFATDVFDRVTVNRWMECFTWLLKGMTRAVDTAIGELPMLPDHQRKQLVELFNATNAPFPKERLVHELFEEQVERTPHAVAVEHESGSLTYSEFNERANRLAHHLREHGAQVGDYVPVLMPRSLEMLIAQLAVLKCGAAYVPLDPAQPADRKLFMIRDCGARRVLVLGPAPADLMDCFVEWVDCKDVDGAIARRPRQNVRTSTRAQLAAYVMYTSGSTGTPKGVIVPHRAVNRLAINGGYAQLEPTDCIAHCSNPTFDASTFEIWGSLLNGARVLVVPQQVVLDAERFGDMLRQHRVTILWITVGLFTQYADVLAGVFPQLRYLMTGGDVVDPVVVRRVLRTCPPQQLLNAYGPTECTTFATTYRIDDLDNDARSISIGRPISNTRVYILDVHRNPVPIGVTGELYIGGPGVAAGYLNRPELTAERFIADPFSDDRRARLYRTGDLGRWRADGNIEFIGRNDQQVKIRGYRIEPGEIEAALLQHRQVGEAIVLAREDVPGEKRLVAYITHRGACGPGGEELRSFLKGMLPEYMVPSAFVVLDRLPLTPNGKVDRRALQAPPVEAYASRPYEPPQSEVEKALASVWQGLLRLERVGRYDNFFELGGHSLLMVQMIERLRRIGLSAKVRDIYESFTLADLARTLAPDVRGASHLSVSLIPNGCEAITPQMLPLIELEPTHIDAIVQAVPAGAANIQDIYPLTPLQEGILFHHLLDEQGIDPYVLPTLLAFSSRVQLDAFTRSLQAVIDRHDILRTAVLWHRLPQPVQVVYRRATLPVEEVSLDPKADPIEQMASRMTAEYQRLNLRQAPMLRLQVATHPDSKQWYALLHMHHVVCDHESHDLMFAEVIAHMQGRGNELPAPVSYRNHVAQALASSRVQDAETFFRSKLADIDEPTMPFGLADVRAGGIHVDQALDPIAASLANRVRMLARRMAVSCATLFHAAWALVLARTSTHSDIVFGSVLLGRLQGSAGAQRTLGMFINTLPLRLQLENVSAHELVQQTHRELMELLNHEQASLSLAQRCSGIDPAAPLFTTLLNYRHSADDFKTELSAAGVRVLAHRSWTNYPIMVAVDDSEQGFTLSAKTDRRIDPRRVLGYLSTAMQSLADALESAPQTLALELPILPLSERREVIEQFNATKIDYPREKPIHELFEEQAKRTAHAVAVEHGERAMTYAEINSRANRLARYLRTRGVAAGQLVGICVERGPEMVVGLLGILKSGAAYVPLDPSYPSERLGYMLEDAAPKVVLTQRSLQAVLPGRHAEHIMLDAIGKEIDTYSAHNLSAAEVGVTAQDLVYVIYTSGSTGRPKGTEMPHGSMVNLIEWHRRAFSNNVGMRVLQFAALSFDVAFQETFSTLCTGGTLVLLDEWMRRDARALLELLAERHVERLFVPPLMLQSLAECFKTTRGVPAALREVITAGEQLRVSKDIAEFMAQLRGCRLHNHYGPTETHVVTSLTLTGPPQDWPELPSIGRPIANTQIYILDAAREPVPVAVAGEIYIGGANVARGYRARPELTAERFIADPLGADPHARMYKTGDLGRWRADGTIEYLGRNDDQVKIRGYRIELGEVEGQIARHPGVKEVAVVARDDAGGEKRLVVYLTLHEGSVANLEELRAHAKTELPEHMIPSAFVILEALPLTPSGKLDRRALPAPGLQAFVTREFELPEGEVEQSVATIWQELLRVARVGRRDNFFELGGHSLLAMKLIGQIGARLHATLPVAAVFRYPTLEQMAQLVESLQQTQRAVAPSEGADLEAGFV